uniref:Uncharacterized protein n=1 Tax=Lepeophtheirus salmonis TaxID=72036 RepID=A0A0K2U771_LEPSM
MTGSRTGLDQIDKDWRNTVNDFQQFVYPVQKHVIWSKAGTEIFNFQYLGDYIFDKIGDSNLAIITNIIL